MASKKKLMKAVEQALVEVAEAFDVELDDVLEAVVELYGTEEEGTEKKAKKTKKAEKKTKKAAKKTKKKEKEAEEAPAYEVGDKVKVKVEGKWRRGTVKKILKTKVAVELKGGDVVKAPKDEVKPIKKK